MRIVNLSLYPPCPWFYLIKNDIIKVNILSCKLLKKSIGSEALIEIESKKENIVNKIKKHPLVKNVNLRKISNKKFFGIIETEKCTCRISGLINYHIIESYIDNEGKLNIGIVVNNEKYSLKNLIKNLKSLGVEVKIKRYKRRKRKYLTLKQKMIIKYALDKGFFDYPRNISLEDLAKDLNVAPSTISEIMRRGLKGMLSEYFNSLNFEKK